MKLVLNGKALWVNYHHLYCFHQIVIGGGLAAASKTVGIGQSALSIQMKQFERDLGFPLFERSGRRLHPNEAGRIVMSYAREIFRLGSEMLETLHDQPTANRTHLQIGALDTIPKHLTVQLVQAALAVKDCTVSIVEDKSHELLRDLTDHRIDLILTNHLPAGEPGRVFSRRIARLPLWVVGGKKFVRLKKGFPGNLEGQPFVVPTGDSRVRHEFENFCQHLGLTLDYLAETQDVMVQKLLALQEVGLTVMPEFAVREYLAKKELFLIGKLQGVFEEIFLVSASRKIENPVASHLMRNFQVH